MADSTLAQERVALVAPIFNDWACVDPFLAEVAQVAGDLPPIDVFLVDDGSIDRHPSSFAGHDGLASVTVLRLGTNLGHQRAIASGLVELSSAHSHAAAIVMDADGEDRPSDIPELWRLHQEHPEYIIVAERRQRTEAIRFRFFYRLYKFLFRVLTGQDLDFGNFSLVPAGVLDRLVLMPELWNHYPATLMRSRVPLQRVPLDRGHRYQGRSRMNFTSLVNHGLAGISAFIDTAFARLLAVSMSLMGLLLAFALITVVVRVISRVPVPGWLALGTTVAMVALFQLMVALIVLSFLTLSTRSSPSPPPSRTAPAYVAERWRVQ
jgi:glycosyltransferase involved in cell wall biosynthesis